MSIPVEIERRFLVRGRDWPVSKQPQRIVQGYLASEGGATVRVRRMGDQARLTIKDRKAAPGQARAEFEYEIPLDHAEHLLRHVCSHPPLEKLRHKVQFAGLTWVIDEFQGANRGLVVAEVELLTPDQSFPRPIWTGREVTGEERYRNSTLFHHPFAEWSGRNIFHKVFRRETPRR